MLLFNEGPGRYCSNRLFEWFAVTVMMSTGIVFLGDHGANSNFNIMVVKYFADPRIGLLLIIVGGLRAAILVINGNAPVWGPRLRAAGSLCGASLWAAISIAMVVEAITQGTYFASLAQYSALATFELIAAYRSATDRRQRVTFSPTQTVVDHGPSRKKDASLRSG